MGRHLQHSRSLATRAALDGVFAGGGEMGELMYAMDWARTPLGEVPDWPASLRTMVRVMLNNRHPMAVWWGQDCLHLYNDAYRPILGDKHPESLLGTGAAVWADSWKIIGPMAQGVLDGGPATWNENFLFPVDRRGFLEETYFTFSYSPIPDDAGRVGGVLITTKETTAEVQDDRQMRTLRDLANISASAESAEAVLRDAAAVLDDNDADFPFALLYLADRDEKRARLVGASGLGRYEGDAAVTHIALDDPAAQVWPLSEAMQGDAPLIVEDLVTRVGAMPGGHWPQAPDKAVVVPLRRPGLASVYGFLVSGINPGRLLNARYLDFFRLAADAIIKGISNARALEEERKRAKALAEIDRAKTAFFSNVSHEFRTPLTLMLGPVEDLLNGVHGKIAGTQRLQLALLHRNALRMQKLVNALLDFSRIESGRISASYEPVDLAALTRDAASAFRSAIEHAGLDFHMDCPSLDETFYVDRDMWEKIVLNLLSNAVKFTFKGGIEVTLRTTGDAAELRVSDTGTGIARAELPHLFERFYRVQGAQARTHEGSGIGLALVRELVELHGGRITVDSTPGKGSVFTVTIPSGCSHLPSEQVDASRARSPGDSAARSFVEEVRGWIPGGEAHESATRPRGERHAASPNATGIMFKRTSSGRILLADDNLDMLDYIRRILEPHWTVETYRNGEKALVAARANRPDLVLTDVMMPGLDGFRLLQELRKDNRTRDVPVIMLSARAGEEARVEGLQAGAEDYLTKPFSARELLARVNTQLELGKLRRAIETERQKLSHVFNDAPVAIAVWRSPQHVFELANPRYLEMFGRKDVIGKTIREVFPDPELERQGAWRIWDQVYATGRTFTDNRYRFLLAPRGNGMTEALNCSLTLAALRNERQDVTGVVAVFGTAGEPA